MKISKLCLSLMSLVALAGAGVTSSAKQEVKFVNADGADHYMAVFNNHNSSMTNSVPSSWSTNFTVTNVDSTSNVALKVSSGRYRTSSGNDDFLEFGRYDEVSGWPSATAATVQNSTDEEFTDVYADIQSDISSWTFVSVAITTSYISDVQDIAMFWKGAGAGYVYLIYQLEGENQDWHILGRDDGEYSGGVFEAYKSYSSTNGFGSGTDNTWNKYAAFSASYNSTAEPRADREFATVLKGNSARLGFVYVSNRGTNNNIKITSFMVNRAKSIMSFVDALQSGVYTSSSTAYNTLVEMGGFRILQSQVNAINERYLNGDSESVLYFDTFDGLYYDLTGEHLAYSPIVQTLRVVADQVAFDYDGLQHSPIFHFVDNDSGDTVNAEYAIDHYSCDATGYNGTDAPVDPYWYSMVYNLNADKYVLDNGRTTYWIVFHIDDSASILINNWKALREAGEESGMCYYLTEETKEPLEKIITRYDNLSESEKAIVDATLEDDEMTYIGSSIEYFKGLLESGRYTSPNNGDAPIALALNNNTTTNLTYLFIALGVITLVGYFLINKKQRA